MSVYFSFREININLKKKWIMRMTFHEFYAKKLICSKSTESKNYNKNVDFKL